MSKKVLKLAGRRPMLLALIMATAILGLLFSGWLTPTPGRAQTGGGNSASGDEKTNCPNYTTNVSVSCPAITNGEDLSPLSFCVVLGKTLPDPSWTSQPGATPGSVVTTITETCSNVVTSASNAITYSFSWHYQNPPGKPAKPTKADTYSATAVGVISSSDTNNCPNPSAPTWGITWNVIDPSIDSGSIQGTADNGGKTWSVDWRKCLSDIQNNSGANMFVLSEPNATLYLTYNWYKEKECCPNGGSAMLNKQWYTGTAGYNLSGSYDLTVLSAFPGWYQAIVNYLGTLNSDWMQQLGNITGLGNFSVGNSVSVAGNINKRDTFEDDCYGCTSSFTTGVSSFNAAINDSVTSSLFGGVNIYVKGYATGKLRLYAIDVPPTPATQMIIYSQDDITYGLYSFAKIGKWSPGVNWLIDAGDLSLPATVVDTVCTSPNM